MEFLVSTELKLTRIPILNQQVLNKLTLVYGELELNFLLILLRQ